MSEPADFDRLLNLYKALGNESRLKIIAMLADGELTVREIAQRLNLREPTVSEHLAMLKNVGLVTARSEGNFRYYAFDAKALNEMNRALLSREKLASLSPQTDDEDDNRILRNYVKDDRLTQIPTSWKRKLVILRWLVEKFEFGRRYTEREVNAIISLHHPDFATLRRHLVDTKLMQREKGIYWRVEQGEDAS